MKNKIDKLKIQKAIKDRLEAIGENPEREGLIETPKLQSLAGIYFDTNIHSNISYNVTLMLDKCL